VFILDEKIQLAEWFVLHVVKATAGVENRIKNAINSIERFMQIGWTIKDLQDEISEFSKTYPQIIPNIYHLDEIIGNKQPPNNLIDPEMFYYHNALREVPPPVKIKMIEGKPVREEQSFYLEMKKRFTMQDLLAYWYEHNGVKPNSSMLRQDEGKFNYLLGFYTVDELLFAIDVSKSMRAQKQQMPLRNVFDLERYMEDARIFMEGKKNVHQLAGINRVIAKRE